MSLSGPVRIEVPSETVNGPAGDASFLHSSEKQVVRGPSDGGGRQDNGCKTGR